MVGKTCGTCDHAKGAFSSGRCALSGFYQTVERRNPSACGVEYRGWIPKRGFKNRVLDWWYGVERYKDGEQS
jgi:hypothetical protein